MEGGDHEKEPRNPHAAASVDIIYSLMLSDHNDFGGGCVHVM